MSAYFTGLLQWLNEITQTRHLPKPDRESVQLMVGIVIILLTLHPLTDLSSSNIEVFIIAAGSNLRPYYTFIL